MAKQLLNTSVMANGWTANLLGRMAMSCYLFLGRKKAMVGYDQARLNQVEDTAAYRIGYDSPPMGGLLFLKVAAAKSFGSALIILD